MPFPTRYTRIPYIADDAIDIGIDRQRGLVWTLTGGGYSYHDPEWETFDDGPNFFKIRMSDGVVLTSGRGPLVPWDYEDYHTSPENIANNFETGAFSVAPSTGNLYVETYNRYSSTGQIHCLDPNDFHILFSSPLLTGLYRATDWIVVFEPYVYYLSYIPGGSPPMRLGVTRLPLSLAQVDWSALTYSGIDSFEIPHDGDIAVDSGGNVWSGCMKTLAKVSPTGVVTSYNLAASLNANACIQTVGYDPGTNSLGVFVSLRLSNGTGAFVAPYAQIVKVDCATGAVTATFSAPTDLRLQANPLARAWEHIYDGRVLLKLSLESPNTAENRGALVDFDLRSMAIMRIYRLQEDWGLDDTPVEPVYEESPLSAAQDLQDIIPDFAGGAIWGYNGWSGWIYPNAEYPQGSYGVWQFSLNEVLLITDGLVACWDLDEASGNRLDHVGGPVNTLLPRNAPMGVPGHIGTAVHFVKTDEQYLYNSSTGPTTLTGPFTIAFWVRPTASATATSGLLTNGFSTMAGQYDFVVLSLASSNAVLVSFNGGQGGVITSSSVLTVGAWNFVMLWRTLSPNVLSLQLNADPVETASFLTPPAVAITRFNMGATGGNGGTAFDYFDGDMDSVMVWDRALSAEERAFVRNGGAGFNCTFQTPLPACPEPPAYFHDALLDQYISYGCKIKIKFQTYVTKMRQGHEERIGEWQDPLWTFDITPALRDQADLDYLLAFFRARQGPLYIFKFFNPLDFQVVNEVFGYGDGVTQTFQLSRRYATGLPGDGLYYVRPITLPAPGVQVFSNGVPVEEGLWGLCPLGGTAVFTTPPPPGAVLTWSGMYYTPVRFLNGRVYSTVEHYQHYEDQIMLVEERLGVYGSVLTESESPDFVEVCFPPLYAQRATMGPEIDVITITSDSGGTLRQLQFQSAKIRFTVEETEQPQSVVASLLAFFLNRKGRLYGFRAKDITDFSLNGAVLEAADGTRTQFQIVKNYGSGAQNSVRTILKPNADVIVDIAGTPVDPQPSVSTETGIITFASPPAPGSVITCTGTFDVPVRFNADEAVFSIQGFEAFSMEAMTLIEMELGLPGFTIEPLVPALMSAQAQATPVSAPAPMPRLAMPGQESCQLPPRPAVTQYLEFRGGTTGSGAGAYSGLQVERPGSMYRLLAGATSLTVAFLVSHVKSGTPSGVPGAVYPMALFSHVMPGMGTDPALYPSTGFTLYLANYGAGIALDAALGAYKYTTSGSLCVPQLNLTPRVPAQGAVSATPIADNNLMHAYVVTFDWLSHQAYWSGSIYGRQEFPPEAFLYNTCFAGTGGADARLLEATAAKYLGSKDFTIGQGETVNDGWLGVVSQAPHTPAFHSPLSASVYEHLLLPTFGRVDMQRILRDVHATILRYWGSKYSTGYANVQSPVAPGFDLFWWRADENVSVADTPTGAIAAWAPVVCGFQWMKAHSTLMSDEGQPRLHPITTMPALSDALMLADGRRLLARQT